MSLNVNTVNTHKKSGECEAAGHEGPCDGIPVFLMHHNIWMCAPCKAADEAISAQNTAAKKLIETSRQIDASVKVVPDVILAKSVAFVELQGAILSNSEIPDSEKDYALVKEIQTRVEHFQSIVTGHRQALNDAENELRMWQVNGQTAASKLRTELREQFKSFDVNYAPAKPKTVKPVTTKVPAAKFGKADLKEAALKYGIAAHIIQMVAVRRNVSADEAGKMLSGPAK